MLGFGPFCLNLGHIAWILAFGRILVSIGPKGDEALGMRGRRQTDGRMDKQIPRVLQDFVPFGVAALLPLN